MVTGYPSVKGDCGHELLGGGNVFIPNEEPSLVGLEVGDSTRDVPCPHCGGGANKEKSFVVSRTNDGYVWVCHRASCGFRGASTDSGGERLSRLHEQRVGQPREVGKGVALHPFEREVLPLPEEVEAYIRQRFGVCPQGTRFSDSGRVLYPACDPHRRRWGWVARAYPEFYKGDMGTASKSIFYQDREAPFGLHFPTGIDYYGARRLVVVEDTLSAEKLVSIGVPSAALLGTNLSFDVAARLSDELGLQELIICLDFDALVKAGKLAKELSLAVRSLSVAVLKDDPKDTDEDTLREKFL